MTHFLAFVIGATSGIAAAVVTSFLSFRTTVWEQRRHDYGELLIALANRDPGEIVRRLELVALVGTKPIAEKALAIKSEIESKGAVPLSAQSVDGWHSALFELMRTDIQSWTLWFRR